jgi:hypothetical protein
MMERLAGITCSAEFDGRRAGQLASQVRAQTSSVYGPRVLLLVVVVLMVLVL